MPTTSSRLARRSLLGLALLALTVRVPSTSGETPTADGRPLDIDEILRPVGGATIRYPEAVSTFLEFSSISVGGAGPVSVFARSLGRVVLVSSGGVRMSLDGGVPIDEDQTITPLTATPLLRPGQEVVVSAGQAAVISPGGEVAIEVEGTGQATLISVALQPEAGTDASPGGSVGWGLTLPLAELARSTPSSGSQVVDITVSRGYLTKDRGITPSVAASAELFVSEAGSPVVGIESGRLTVVRVDGSVESVRGEVPGATGPNPEADPVPEDHPTRSPASESLVGGTLVRLRPGDGAILQAGGRRGLANPDEAAVPLSRFTISLPTPPKEVTVELDDTVLRATQTTFVVGQPYALRVTNVGTVMRVFSIGRDSPESQGSPSPGSGLVESTPIAPAAEILLTWIFDSPGRFRLVNSPTAAGQPTSTLPVLAVG